jgi:GTPase SAR1 family protein
MKQIQEHASLGVKTILIGNKSDLVDERKVQYLEGKMLADKYCMPFLEVSAKTGDNIQESFMVLGKEIMSSIKNNEIKYKSTRPS